MSRLYYIIFFMLLLPATYTHAQLQTESTTIKGIKYTVHLDQWSFWVLKGRSDTLLNITPDNYVGFKFKDFNKDGYKDLFLEWGGNLPERYSLYLFVPTTSLFQEVKYFSDFPAATPIQGTSYYYSYYRNGCADNAWGSHLFSVQNYTATKVGLIKGEGCGIKDGIYIHRVKADKTILTKTLPLQTIKTYKDGKFGFLQQYWSTKYKQFI